MNREIFSALLVFIFLTIPSHAGVFLEVVECLGMPENNFCRQGMTRDGLVVSSIGIVHPKGYDGTGGMLDVSVCVSTLMDPNSVDLVEPTKKAVRLWNELKATTRQCRNCTVQEDGNQPQAPEPFHAASAILHELGHCAMGLDHPNLQFDPPGAPDQRETTSFTMSYGGSPLGISEGNDGIRGSFDDVQQAGGGQLPTSVNWFRRPDNNPVIVDDTIIDILTFSRAIPNLPTDDHKWSASANRHVAEALGFPDTQTPMYALAARTLRYEGLTADDVNMVRMGMTGQDRMAGTIDDYTINLQFVEGCVGADVLVTFLDIEEPPNSSNIIATCGAQVVQSFPQPNPQTAQHYSVATQDAEVSFVVIGVDSNDIWDFSIVDEVFSDSFESGDTSSWDQTIP